MNLVSVSFFLSFFLLSFSFCVCVYVCLSSSLTYFFSRSNHDSMMLIMMITSPSISSSSPPIPHRFQLFFSVAFSGPQKWHHASVCIACVEFCTDQMPVPLWNIYRWWRAQGKGVVFSSAVFGVCSFLFLTFLCVYVCMCVCVYCAMCKYVYMYMCVCLFSSLF